MAHPICSDSHCNADVADSPLQAQKSNWMTLLLTKRRRAVAAKLCTWLSSTKTLRALCAMKNWWFILCISLETLIFQFFMLCASLCYVHLWCGFKSENQRKIGSNSKVFWIGDGMAFPIRWGVRTLISSTQIRFFWILYLSRRPEKVNLLENNCFFVAITFFRLQNPIDAESFQLELEPCENCWISLQEISEFKQVQPQFANLLGLVGWIVQGAHNKSCEWNLCKQ